MEQITLFDLMFEKYKITKPIRLIELFGGYGSQNLALKYLGANYEHHKLVEWATKSIEAYNDIHTKDYTDYSKDLTDEQVLDYLADKGISMDYNQPMTRKQISKKSIEWQRKVYNDIIATKNLVDISRVHAVDLEINGGGYEYVMTYSFPCQDLSLAGLGKGMSRDSGTRSGLLWQVERILLECKEINSLPNILIMENVPEVKGSNNIQDFTAWVHQLEKLGYSNYCDLLNAKDFGIPQNRKRCFMVSILGEYNYKMPRTMRLKYKLKDFLEKDVSDKYYLSQKMIECFMSNGTGNYPRKERFLQNLNRKDNEIGNAITTLAGQRPTDNFIIEQENIENNVNENYMGTYDYTQSDTLRPTLERRVHFNNEISCTILASGNNNGIIEKKEKVIHNKKLKETLEQNDITKIENVAYIDGFNRRIINDGTTATINTGVSFRNQDYIAIKNATKEGYLFAEPGDGIDISGRMQYHRGNVQKGKCQTISCKGGDNVGVVVKEETNPRNDLRIRKLTPTECFRLMGVKDSDSKNIKQTDGSKYHLAGDSIVTSVLMAIFGELLGIDYKTKINELVEEMAQCTKNGTQK